MKNPLRKITIIFLVIVLVPVIILSSFEIGSLSKNEEMVKKIYQNQLDAILYSINQYSDDIVQSWANDVEQVEIKEGLVYQEKYIKSILSDNWTVNWVMISDQTAINKVVFARDSAETRSEEINVLELVTSHKETISRLVKYQEQGFRKIAPIDHESASDEEIILFFVLNKNLSPFKYGFISIDPQAFITNSLSPKIQSISEDKFIISAYLIENDSMVFSTKTIESDLSTFDYRDVSEDLETQNADIQQRDFWLLPGYYLGITQAEVSLDKIIRKRTYINIGLLVFLIGVLTLGLIFLYRNVRREMQLSQAKSEFVSNVSHEIRTPLSLIQMFAETLEMNRVKTEEKKFEYYTIIKKESERLSRIVNRILSFSQIEAKKRRFEMTELDLKDLVDELFQSYDFHLKNKGFIYNYKCPEILTTIVGDKEAITEAIINLVDNAIKYSDDKKQLDIELGKADQQVFVRVKDFGIGIDKSHQQEVFDQFFRVPSNDVHNTKGSGLGLTLVKHIMDAHHGHITLESAPGKGSTFTLYFPAKSIGNES